MVERLRSLGREVEYHVFDDEGHGFAKHAKPGSVIFRLINRLPGTPPG